MGNSYDEVVGAWITSVLYDREARVPRNPRMPVSGDSIFSYGSHFEMARLLRDRKGESAVFLVNGDTYSVTTSRHQSKVRSEIARSPVGSVILPFSTLNAAGIDMDTIRLLHRTRDWTEEKEHVVTLPHGEVPPGAVAEWVPVTETVGMSLTQLYAAVDAYNLKRYEDWANRQQWARESPDGYWSKEMLKKCPTALTLAEWLRMHWNAEYGHGNRVNNEVERVTNRRMVTHQEYKVFRNGWKNSEWDIEYVEGGLTEYRYTTRRHWLGESLIEAKVAYTVRRTCRRCEGTGRAEGPVQANWVAPRTRRDTVWGFEGHPNRRTIDTLQPIPGYWQEQSWSIPQCTACRGRGRWTQVRYRTAKFLSAFDRNETRPSYFLCELPPKSPAMTIEEALDALKPEAVRLAELMGREVKRQGDIFAIPLGITRRELKQAGARFEKRGDLFSTNHVATETAYLPDGTTLVRGCLYHAPQWRQPDHRRVKLGKEWHVAQKNLVPTAA